MQLTYLAIASIATFLLVLLLTPQAHLYQSTIPQIQCLPPQNNRILCVQCLARDPLNISPYKGLIVRSEAEFQILKVKQKEPFLTCKEYLQLVDYSTPVEEVRPQTLGIVSDLVRQLGGQWIDGEPHVQEIVEPQFQHLALFRWFHDRQTTKTTILYPSPKALDYARFTFFYVLNGVVIFITVSWFLTAPFLEKPKPALLPLFLGQLLVWELVTSNILSQANSDRAISLARGLILALSLYRMQVVLWKVCLFLLGGLLVGTHGVLGAILAGITAVLIGVQGWQKLQLQPVWRFLLITLGVSVLNLLVWEGMYSYTADVSCRIVEMALGIFIPLGLFLLKEKKVFNFREYRPSDPERRSISLSGYEEEDDY